jgi:hypothetical protein
MVLLARGAVSTAAAAEIQSHISRLLDSTRRVALGIRGVGGRSTLFRRLLI